MKIKPNPTPARKEWKNLSDFACRSIAGDPSSTITLADRNSGCGHAQKNRKMTPIISQIIPAALRFRDFIFGSACAQSPNDPKLSDGGAWRGSCEVRRRRDMQARKEERTDETRTSQK